MSKHNELGKDAEIIAANFLKNLEYDILEINYRYGHKEIDIICKHQNVIIFVEVKSRSTSKFGFPEIAVTPQKQAHLKIAADYYLQQMVSLIPSRFDVVAITFLSDNTYEITHFKDAFY